MRLRLTDELLSAERCRLITHELGVALLRGRKPPKGRGPVPPVGTIAEEGQVVYTFEGDGLMSLMSSSSLQRIVLTNESDNDEITYQRQTSRAQFISAAAISVSVAVASLAALDPPMTEVLSSESQRRETRRLRFGVPSRERRGARIQELRIRLAELLSDEARAHYQVARAREGISDKSLQVPQVKTLKQQAVTVYQEFLKDYPRSELRARALYNMGQEYRELGDYEKMRESFEQIVTELPNHPLSNEALLILGGDYFDRSKLNEAGERFAKITQAKIQKVTGLAYYKLAWVKVNQQDCDAAIKSFEAAIDRSHRWITSHKEDGLEGSQFDVRREALVDMVFCFSKERPDKGVVEHFKRLAYDRGPLVAALEKLSRRYSILDRSEGLRDVSRALLDLAPDHNKRRDDAENLHSSLKKIKDYKLVGEDVARLTSTFARVARSTRLTSERSTALIRFEQLSRDLATSAQVALEKRYGTKSWDPKKTEVQQLQDAYVRYLETFGAKASLESLLQGQQRAKLTKVKDKTSPKSKESTAPDEPFDLNQNILDVLANLSAVYSRSGRDYLAAQRFYERAAILGNEGSEDAYQAVLHFQRALSVEGQSRGELVISRALLRRAASQLLAGQLPKDQGAKVRYAIALTYYEEGRLDKAVECLTVATEYPNTTQGDSA